MVAQKRVQGRLAIGEDAVEDGLGKQRKAVIIASSLESRAVAGGKQAFANV